MSIYARATLGEADNRVVFNDYTIDPVFRVKARAPSKWQIRQQDLPVPFESGSSDFLTLIGDSAYIISGTMYPSSESAYDAGLAALRTVASLDFEQADPASDAGYVPYMWGNADGDLTQQVFLKPLYVQLAETTTQGFVQPFTIYCKVKDPTIYGGTLRSAVTQTGNPNVTTGSAVYPFTYPVVFGASMFNVSSVANNAGTLPTYPSSIQITGPINTPKLLNQTTGEYFIINTVLNSVSDVMTIIYDKDTLSITLNGASQIRNLTNDSTLFKIHPGANQIILSGASVGTGAYAAVNFYDAYPLA